MGGNAAAEAAPWQLVRLRAMLCAAEANSSAVGHRPAWRLRQAQCKLGRVDRRRRQVAARLADGC